MKNAKLTVRLPEEDLEFAKQYARENKLTLTALVHRFFSRLRTARETEISPHLEPIVGLVPPDVNAAEEHRKHLLEKQK